MRYDYLLLGGGLQSGLLALSIRYWKPSAKIALIEQDKNLGGNHTWSFHAGDVREDSRPWFEPLVQWRWPGYDVIFPDYRRRIDQTYGAFTGQRLDEVVRANFSLARDCELLTGATVVHADAHEATLADGRQLQARVVIDSRGPNLAIVPAHSGYQKFLGLEVRLRAAHEITHPILMDTRIAQLGGMRFFYVLPFTEDRMLVEDTCFSNDADFDADTLRERIIAWIASQGWQIAEVTREERGVLPMPCEPSPQCLDSLLLCGGYAGGWFNPATGYSLPLTVQFACFVATHDIDELSGPALARVTAQRERRATFFLLLNRLLFDAAPPETRRNVLERFYRLPEDCITRFYAMHLQPQDQLRLLLGRPPQGIRLRNAIKAIGKWALVAPWLIGKT